MFSFLFARHRKAYMQIAWQFKINPERVYKLAHGSKATGETEKKVLHELLAREIIHRRTDNKF